MNQPSRAFARGVAVSAVGAVVVGCVNFLVRRLLWRGLEKEAYGFFYSAYALVSLAALFVGGGLGRATSVLVSRHLNRSQRSRARAIFAHTFIARILVAGLAAVVLALGAGPLLRGYFIYADRGHAAFLLICLFAPLTAAFGGLLSLLTAFQEFMYVQAAQVLQAIGFLAAAWFWIPRFGVAGAAAALLVSHMTVVAALLLHSRRRHHMLPLRGGLDRDVACEVWRFTRWTIGLITGLYLMSWLDTLMLTGLKGLESVAVYNLAVPLAQVLMVVGVIPGVVTPIATELWQRGEKAEIARLCGLVQRAMILLAWAVAAGLIPSAAVVIGLLFGEGGNDAAVPLVLLAAGVPLLVTGQCYVNVLTATGRPAAAAGAVAAAVAANVVCNAVLICALGATGAALATILSYGVMLGVARFRLRDELRASPVDAGLLRVSLAGACACLIAAVARPYAHGAAPRLGLAVLAVVGYGVAVARPARAVLAEAWGLLFMAAGGGEREKLETNNGA